MLRRLLQGIEQGLGPAALAEVSFLIYWGGIVLLGLAVLAPFYRRWLEYSARSLGLAQHWVITCGGCQKQTVVTGPRCGYCDEALGISGALRRWTGLTRKPPGLNTQQWRWRVHLLGNVLFFVLALWFVTSLGTFSVEGQLHQLFVGLALQAWATLGRFAGVAMRLDRGGFLARAGAGVLMLAAIGVMGISLVLAGEARPASESVLAQFSTNGESVLIQDQELALTGRDIGFEYLQLDHEVFGYHGIIALAFLGRERLPVSGWFMKDTVVGHFREHAEAYEARGLTVRLRTDRVRLRSGQSYQVVERRGQVHIRRVGAVGPATR